MLAILQDAVECFQKYAFAGGNKKKGLFKDREDWILKNDYEWVFSFVNVCETFGINPHYLRRGLSRWKQNAIRERSRRTTEYVQRKTGRLG
jgi:hypothetical protein